MLQEETIKEQFLLLSQEPDTPELAPYLAAAMAEVREQLLPEFVEDPPEVLCSYAAALAMRLWVYALAARTHTTCTEAGAVRNAAWDNAAQRNAACALVSAYRALYSRYLKDDTFTLLATPATNKGGCC